MRVRVRLAADIYNGASGGGMVLMVIEQEALAIKVIYFDFFFLFLVFVNLI